MSAPHSVQLPDGRTVVFTPRSVMKANQPKRSIFSPADGSLPTVPLPIDWTKGGKLQFPILGNDQYGDCMYCAAVHLDQLFTGNVGTEATYDTATVVKYYKNLSGGDHGLDEEQVTGEWAKGLCGNPQASILDSLDIDPTNAPFCRSAIQLFGGVFFMLSVPNRWINEAKAGCTWDAPALPNPMNGHGTFWGGVDQNGDYDLGTWGFMLHLTEKGVPCCDPSAFVVFSLRWFDPKTGLAPNGFSYDQLAEYWVKCGGKALPKSPFPSAYPPVKS